MLAGCVPWPGELGERYRSAGFWSGERLGDLTRDVASADPQRTALVAASGRFSYGEVDRRADRLAAGLWERGLRPGERVVTGLPNGLDFVTVSLALLRLGAIPVYALPAHRRSELEYLCRHTEASALILPDRERDFDFGGLAAAIAGSVPSVRDILISGESDRLTTLDGVDADPLELAPPDPQDVAFLLLSGGTTGMPKLIPRTHDDYACQLRCSAEAVGADASTVYLAALPMAHNAALGCPGVLGTLRLGGRVVIARTPSPDEVFALITRERPTLTTAMPAFLVLWSELADAFGGDMSGVVVEVGGAQLDPQVARVAQEKLGCTLTHWFGMAEGVLCCTRPGDPIALAATTQGRPVCSADELCVADAGGRPVPAGGVGELLVRGPMTLRGYYRDREHDARAFTGDGFLRTGDLVRLTPAGELVVVGRIKDVVNRGGEKVAPGEVEDHLRTHPAVRDAAVVAVPDRVLGEKACAVVIADGPPPALGDLRRHLSGRGVADYKLPDRLELVDEFPRTAVGKVDKAKLRAALSGARAGARRPGDQAAAGRRTSETLPVASPE